MSNWIQVRYDKPSKYLRSFRFNLNQWGAWNFGGDRLDMGSNINAHWVFANNWATGAGYNVHDVAGSVLSIDQTDVTRPPSNHVRIAGTASASQSSRWPWPGKARGDGR